MGINLSAPIVAVALPLALSACPAFLSDNFQVVSDAGQFTDTNETNPPEVEAGQPESAVDGDAKAEAADDAVSTEASLEAAVDSSAEAEAAAEDATVDVAVESSTEAEASTCTPIPSVVIPIGACGGSYTTGLAIHVPAAWCQYIVGSKTPIEFGDSWVAMPTPPECQCVETYTCSCIFAHVPMYCPPGTSFITCNAPPQPGVASQGSLGIQCHG